MLVGDVQPWMHVGRRRVDLPFSVDWLSEIMILLIFFFSSRRRHTRFDCDWSSDVCSSDLLRRRPGLRSPILGQSGTDGTPDCDGCSGTSRSSTDAKDPHRCY